MHSLLGKHQSTVTCICIFKCIKHLSTFSIFTDVCSIALFWSVLHYSQKKKNNPMISVDVVFTLDNTLTGETIALPAVQPFGVNLNFSCNFFVLEYLASQSVNR